jgi:dTDP-4-amino-4,6-dideoxygalactose transaminase
MNSVQLFENEIANWFGSPYAVATDCCTHAIELSLRYKQIKKTSCPTRTYVSIPMTLKKLGIEWDWYDEDWISYYYLKDTNIIDAAVLWETDSYIPGTLMCLSFQFQKHLSLGRGGAILCDTKQDYDQLKKMTHDGRVPVVPWKQQNIDTLGYHYYMTLETAEDGLAKLKDAKNRAPKIWTQDEYPYLPDMTVFK